jgi:cation transport regulator ChaC
VQRWIFGYGSLVWRPAFAFEERYAGYLLGWARRFWQGSVDHRGVPGAPGRVVTLVRAPGERCDGVVYRIADEEWLRVLASLDVREQGGYARQAETVHFDRPTSAGRRSVDALVYFATAENPNYLGPAPIAALVEQIRSAVGPSGANVDYVLELAAALRQQGAEDPHVFELADRLCPRVNPRDRG